MSIAEKLTTIAENMQKVYDAGKSSAYRNAYDEGYEEGFADGHSEGYDAGSHNGYGVGYSQAESDLWDSIQNFGNRTNYYYAFQGAGWTDQTFRPKYDIVPTTCSQMFEFAGITDLSAILADCGVILDFSQASPVSYPFSHSKVTKIPRINVTTAKYYNQTFYNCQQLHTIEAVVSTADCRWNNTFLGNFSLVNLTIEGEIGQNGFSVVNSTKLSHDSLMSIITALKDYSTDTSGTQWVVTLGSANIEKLTDEEQDLAYEKGWVLA